MARDQTSFLRSLGLTTSQHSLEIKSRLNERRRRHNVSPFIFVLLDQEKQDENGIEKPEPVPKKKRRAKHSNIGRVTAAARKMRKLRANETPEEARIRRKVNSEQTARAREEQRKSRPPKQKLLRRKANTNEAPKSPVSNGSNTDKAEEDDMHDTVCTACGETGELLLCDTCNRVYHLACVNPPLQSVPSGQWFCSRCKEKMEETRLPDLSDIVNSADLYTKYYHERDQEKCHYMEKTMELCQRKRELQQKSKMLSDTIANHIVMKKETMRNISLLQESISKMEQFIDVIKQLAHPPSTDTS